jgi:F-type H+-transporting ATPase subunit epsilon
VPFQLRVVSVEHSLVEGEADFMIANGTDGELGILPHHAPLLTTLRPGALTIRNGPDEQLLFVGGGFLEVLPERVTVLADVAERAEDIDEARAEEARRHAQELLSAGLPPAEMAEMEVILAVAEARLRLARIRKERG